MNSLRWQFVYWISLAILIAGGLFYAILRDGFYREFLTEIDQELWADTFSLSHLLDEYHPDNLQHLREQAEVYFSAKPKGWHVVVRDSERNLLYGSPNLPAEITELHTIALNKTLTYKNFRVLKITSSQPQSLGFTIRLAFSLKEVDQHLARLDRSVISTGLLFLLVGGLLAYFTASRAIAPLQNLTEQVEKIPANPEAMRLTVHAQGNELDRLANVVNQLLSRIAQHVQENRSMLADASHQLRTPLAAIRSSVEVVLNSEQLSDVYTDLLIQVVNETESLEVLVNQLLLLAESEIPARNITREKVAFDQLISQAIEVFEPVAESQEIAIVKTGFAPVWVMGQRHHLRQMFNNLLENAIKFTSVKTGNQNKIIEVALKTTPHSDHFSFMVRDSGIGIDAADIPLIFDRFYRANRARTREAHTPGNGLGLSIVKAVVESHGGSIRVESTPGEGTAFHISLPMLQPESVAVA